jgi:hypothetical protein
MPEEKGEPLQDNAFDGKRAEGRRYYLVFLLFVFDLTV